MDLRQYRHKQCLTRDEAAKLWRYHDHVRQQMTRQLIVIEAILKKPSNDNGQ